MKCVAPFFKSGDIHSNVQMLYMFAVSRGLSFEPFCSSDVRPISGPIHSNSNATNPKAPVAALRVKGTVSLMTSFERVVRAHTSKDAR